MQIVLFEPEIPPNTGNVARLCAATDTILNLVEPLGFSLEDKYLRRAGLDYWAHVTVRVWPSLSRFLKSLEPEVRVIGSSSNGGKAFHHFPYRWDDVLMLGPESTGLPGEALAHCDHVVRIPIRGKVRSLNMSTAAGILLFEAFRSSGLLD